VTRTTTSPDYRLYALDTVPPKPGLVRTLDDDGACIEVEVYELDAASFGTFVAAVTPPLAIGTVTLVDGSEVSGFVCEPYALTGAPEITSHGGWRAYLASIGPPMP
jgi:allophanate hydrolase